MRAVEELIKYRQIVVGFEVDVEVLTSRHRLRTESKPWEHTRKERVWRKYPQSSVG